MEGGTDFQAMLQKIAPEPEPEPQQMTQQEPTMPAMPEATPAPVSTVNGLSMPFASSSTPGITGLSQMNWETEDVIILVLAGGILFLCLMYCKGNNKTVLL